nr:immunoglobulin heavy chain junction region [Mus musculus]
QMRTLRSI